MTGTPRKREKSKVSQSDFTPNDVIVPAENIVDEEFSPPRPNLPPLMAYLRGNNLFVAEIDPATGRMIAGDPILLTDQANFKRAGFQGPEWGYSAEEGASLFFTIVVDGKSQIAYCARQASGEWSKPATVLTGSQSGPFGRMAATGSRDGTTSTQVNYTRWDPKAVATGQPQDRITDRVFYWMDVRDRREHQIPFPVIWHSQPPHFTRPLNGSAYGDLVFGAKDKNNAEQVVRYDTRPGMPETKRAHFLSSIETDQGNVWDHWDPDSFEAPEYGGARVYAVSVLERDEPYPSKIAIYRESQTGGPYGKLELMNILRIPDSAVAAGFTSITSIEPIVTETASFLSLRLVKHDATNPLDYDCSVWLWSLKDVIAGAQPQPGLRRQVSGTDRSQGNYSCDDPEYLLGENELFIYYTVYDPKQGTVDLHLCTTGVSADGSFIAGPNGE